MNETIDQPAVPNHANMLALIAMPGSEAFTARVDNYLRKWRDTDESFILPVSLPRFATGDGKVVLEESARSRDIFIICDPYNYSVTYNIRGFTNHMSPDDHYQNIIRVISAVNGKTANISVLMTMLYGSRQDDRHTRESLDCAMALRQLERCGVKNIITFDAHDPRVQNAVPLISFDNLFPNYQMLKALLSNINDIDLHSDSIVIISPDAGGVRRCLRLSEPLNLEIGMFYKQRDTRNVVGGNNKIERHRYIGNSLEGRDVIIVDDILATGGSLIDSFYKLKELGAKRIFVFITFGMFTQGYSVFDKAYSEGAFNRIFISNLTYHMVEKEERPYICNVDLSKYASYIIDCIHKGMSISDVLNPADKIKILLASLESDRAIR
ncbi:MAG: ribose-phosphate diphosphokinase [Clostridiales bacterium]|jgi:ribose-phosphate pyrophosphokinase|nr:ribose-phosphate diphosphokinase [Clostridiales bacterium]